MEMDTLQALLTIFTYGKQLCIANSVLCLN